MPLKDNTLIFFTNLKIIFKFLKSFFLNGSSFFHRLYSWISLKLPSKNERFFLLMFRWYWLLGIHWKFHFPIVIDNWGGSGAHYWLLMGSWVGIRPVDGYKLPVARTQWVTYYFIAKTNNIYLLYAHYICRLWKGTKLASSNCTPSIFVRNLGDRLFSANNWLRKKDFARLV